ncbi:MAG: UDP-N-acetylglucosamine 2-epimerase (hydrolyzing) [Methanobrevibacter sp.]|nr:UDP-N-acetylglucosamine 2-epimerase (hydrolyzing) [Methanobrevibacter sp.]
MKKRILFITGTRADYGKIKSLMKILNDDFNFEVFIFATGMHMLSKYGFTYKEIEKDGFPYIYPFINQKYSTNMDIALSNTINGLSFYIEETNPDAIVVHGDRLEALAGAVVGAFNNIRVFHIEGGEVSGTIDESIRHAITKFSNFHFVANDEAKKRIIQLGEPEDTIFVFGSPDIDIMYSNDLPDIDEVKKRYEIPFDNYDILMYHPVTTEVDHIKEHVEFLVDEILKSNDNFVVIYPNNDIGSKVILNEYQRFKNNENIRIFPSMRFEYFLSLLRSSDCMVGNSSSGIRETSIYGIPTVDIGSRQNGRYNSDSFSHIIHIDDFDSINDAISNAKKLKFNKSSYFGEGNSDVLFHEMLCDSKIWDKKVQKQFIDIDF